MNNSMLMKQALAEGLINTPGGFRKRAFVHIVRPNQSVIKRGGISHIMDMRTAALVGLPALNLAQKNPADQAGGWSTWATWNNPTGTSISLLRTSWVVPAPPSKQSDQLVYLFNGLQDPAGSEILQPVLQWGISGAGGGSFWSIASWHVDSKGHAFCTESIPVSPGDVLTGTMTELAVFNDGSRNYKCQFEGLANTTLMALGLSELTAAEQTLEAYGLTSREDYPAIASTAMTEISVEIGGNSAPATWIPYTMVNPLYGEHTAIVTNTSPGGEVDLFY